MNNDRPNIVVTKPPAAGSHSVFWSVLHEAGKEQLNELTAAVNRIAPEPGSSVLFDARMIRGSADDLPVLYSSIDVHTHLQIARLYFTQTVASSIDFLGFAIRSFPFQVKSILTRADGAFSQAGGTEIPHRFTLTAFHLGIRHVICQDSNSELCDFLGKYFFDGELSGTLDETAERLYYLRLRNYLNFHNHTRSFPALGGKTAIESLRSFPVFSSIRLFDPFPYLNSAR